MNPVLAWRRERLPMPLFGLLASYLAFAAMGGFSGILNSTLSVFVLRMAVAWCLVAAFRIWDDIADRQCDLIKAPDRVLVGVERLGPFWVTSLVSLTLGVLGSFTFNGFGSVVLILGVASCFGAFYRWGIGHRHHWVLTKYPLIVVALGGHNWTILLLVYLSFCIYEHIDEPEIRDVPGALFRLIPYFLGIGLIVCILDSGLSLWLVPWAIATCLTLFGFIHRRSEFAPTFLFFSILVF